METIQTIPVIDQFLEQWKLKAFEYYRNLEKEYNKLRNKKYELTKENLDSIKGLNQIGCFLRNLTDEKIEKILNEFPNMPEYQKRNFESDLHYIKFNQWKSFYGGAIDICQKTDKELNKFLDREVEAKKRNLIMRIEKKAGNILDATGLYIGSTGEINGIVKGNIKTVKVETISAGGYNVQCYHFRVLVK